MPRLAAAQIAKYVPRLQIFFNTNVCARYRISALAGLEATAAAAAAETQKQLQYCSWSDDGLDLSHLVDTITMYTAIVRPVHTFRET